MNVGTRFPNFKNIAKHKRQFIHPGTLEPKWSLYFGPSDFQALCSSHHRLAVSFPRWVCPPTRWSQLTSDAPCTLLPSEPRPHVEWFTTCFCKNSPKKPPQSPQSKTTTLPLFQSSLNILYWYIYWSCVSMLFSDSKVLTAEILFCLLPGKIIICPPF